MSSRRPFERVSYPHFSDEGTKMRGHFIIHQQEELASLNIYRFVEVCLSSVALEWFNFYCNYFTELHSIPCKWRICTFLLLCWVVYTNHIYVISGWFKGCSRAIWDQMVLLFFFLEALSKTNSTHLPDFFASFFQTTKHQWTYTSFLGHMWNWISLVKLMGHKVYTF